MACRNSAAQVSDSMRPPLPRKPLPRKPPPQQPAMPRVTTGAKLPAAAAPAPSLRTKPQAGAGPASAATGAAAPAAAAPVAPDEATSAAGGTADAPAAAANAVERGCGGNSGNWMEKLFAAAAAGCRATQNTSARQDAMAAGGGSGGGGEEWSTTSSLPSAIAGLRSSGANDSQLSGGLPGQEAVPAAPTAGWMSEQRFASRNSQQSCLQLQQQPVTALSCGAGSMRGSSTAATGNGYRSRVGAANPSTAPLLAAAAAPAARGAGGIPAPLRNLAAVASAPVNAAAGSFLAGAAAAAAATAGARSALAAGAGCVPAPLSGRALPDAPLPRAVPLPAFGSQPLQPAAALGASPSASPAQQPAKRSGLMLKVARLGLLR